MKKIDLTGKRILITGGAGFIGANLILSLLQTVKSVNILTVDNINDYYDVSLKEWRLQQIESEATQHEESKFEFIKGDISDVGLVNQIFADFKPDIVVNLAAQAGVRNSITNPDAYIKSNIIGFYNILEACRHSYDNENGVEHLVFASSSSIYGNGKEIPYKTDSNTDKPISLYAATKKSDEMLAHVYSHLFGIPITGLRFFTVYGPGGRPDMAYFKFTKKLINDEKIQIFNYGNCRRDFTYIDDVVEGVKRVMSGVPEKSEQDLEPAYRIYNIGNHHPENLMEFVKILQDELVRANVLPKDYDFEGHMELVPMQPGDVAVTYADISELEKDFNFKPDTRLRVGLRKFAEWYRDFYELGK
ncbi:GDP-mannose 4,6-dehydratase [Ligilactobacillus salivarius]|uniref:UDP-glucuronate 4-epimerase n=1 Tax=Ligilactobacillus salivarius (strain UCC118) TaxID=362948 RepID=Q1WTE9_LIGS1|nr:GDP-mannose 4,6-dehydratase [Ligilactobacillus salivarius]ABD99788.1 UDP-glucuronate 4-epimerase [Ligilactobacillus salivarius UCC118]MBC6926404.1 NAD-dependent epimerase/dehydratase family protein [Ligilactobacillus salivarius]OQQ76574.1 protein CapI [Ligilactobacillus salivarius]OQR20474.1 protein CapI [Ligilactobacillus salivarius]